MLKVKKSHLLYLLFGLLGLIILFQESVFANKFLWYYTFVFIITGTHLAVSFFRSKMLLNSFLGSFLLLLVNGWIYYLLSYQSQQQEGVTVGYILVSFSFLFILWNCLREINTISNRLISEKIINLLAPLFFFAGIIFIWQMAVIGFRIPFVLLPTPSIIIKSLYSSKELFFADFVQTFIYSVIPGYLMGCLAGFMTALICDKIYFLKQGLLPIGNFMSSLPIVGIAPIMIMWFGFDWHSKAAVIVLITFFPMLINSIAGLNSSSKIELDLIETYNPSYLQKLFFLKLKNATPFIFNALKINSTLALVGGIVAEFFGTPIVGMGFRISTEIGRMNLHLVWATIVVSAIIGSTVYLLLIILEKKLTFWHVSFRKIN